LPLLLLQDNNVRIKNAVSVCFMFDVLGSKPYKA
jgi:hypothetical protein